MQSLTRSILAACLFAGASAARPAAARPETSGPTIQRATVAGVRLDGLDPHQARLHLEQALRPKLAAPVVLTDGRHRVRRTRGELVIRPDVDAMVARAKAGETRVPLRLSADVRVLQPALRRLSGAFGWPARDARVRDAGGHVSIAGSAAGRLADPAASAALIAAAVAERPDVRVLHIVLKRAAPRVATADLRGINGRLARFVTRFNASGKRAHNVRLATTAIDGTVLRPGAVFSLNEAVGARTHGNGYLTAPVFEYGREVPGVGGGVSQVTGTLFNAALVAGLRIVEYRTHSRPVRYLPIGRDATVGWKQFDMRFKNTTRAPVYIRYQAAGPRLVATLYGARAPGQKVSVVVRAQRLGPRRIKAALYRVTRRNGRVVSKEMVGRSDYNWKPDTPQTTAARP